MNTTRSAQRKVRNATAAAVAAGIIALGTVELVTLAIHCAHGQGPAYRLLDWFYLVNSGDHIGAVLPAHPLAMYVAITLLCLSGMVALGVVGLAAWIASVVVRGPSVRSPRAA
ncbi:hypothetical protein OI25_7214 [Paraburkholderia fungorum]|jgi:hypothetical protein|uniref:Uncharacterized protein n=1 Tax=Paraburkholderia fungorum TaxID=134537 RepID=A0AAP5UY36_9BURK|nr:hypothetical protein [Paraburkholderia fungorum]AJZ56970.1 hypothetical protein OI25_7214 [Paraburkholderia fungorum]MDT8842636.1 hypothetical protein [Paraburkholderia fungorum]PRZ49198.1 hypothetical protein BX589_126107 [Paraburkholderia fungorum]